MAPGPGRLFIAKAVIDLGMKKIVCYRCFRCHKKKSTPFSRADRSQVDLAFQ